MHFRCEQCEVSEKINPSSKLTLLGHGKSTTKKKINYEWELVLKNCSNDCVTKDDFKKFASTSLDSESLVIKPNKLTGKNNVMQSNVTQQNVTGVNFNFRGKIDRVTQNSMGCELFKQMLTLQQIVSAKLF